MFKGKADSRSAFLFLMPFTLLYLVFTIFPMLQGLYISMHDWSLMKKIDFVGLDNFIEVFSDAHFYEALKNTLIFVVLSTPLLIGMALLLAMICNQNTKFKKLYRISFFIPSILAVSVVSSITQNMVQPYMGFLNKFLQNIGLLSPTKEIFWLADPTLAWVTIIILTVWWTVGFNMMLYLSALQDIPKSLYEAAEIDGANKWKSFLYITLPQLGTVTKILTMLQVIASFKVFAQIWLTTDGGPGTATRPLIQYIYESGFIESRLGYASALSYVLFVILLLLSYVQYKIRKGEE